MIFIFTHISFLIAIESQVINWTFHNNPILTHIEVKLAYQKDINLLAMENKNLSCVCYK